MGRNFMTSAEVAAALGVGPTSIKRWADSGLLPCVRTPGGHRRFVKEEVERFLSQGAGGWNPDQIDAWVDRLVRGADAFEVQSALFAERSRGATWRHVAETVARVMQEVGQRWASGSLAILDEHAASECVGRAVARCAESIAVGADAPVCLLAAAEGEAHTMGLSLSELVLRAQGWRARWGGRGAPSHELARAMASGDLALVAVAALPGTTSAASLASQAEVLAQAAQVSGVPLVLCGHGAWPTTLAAGCASGPLAKVLRARDFADFESVLVRLEGEPSVHAEATLESARP